MFTRILMIFVLVGGLYYLYWTHHQPPPPPPPPPPPAIMKPPTPAFSPADLEKIRSSAHDTEPSVRWAAIQLLYDIHDSQSQRLVENTLIMDTEPSLRQNALAIVSKEPAEEAIPSLLKALKDSDLTIRAMSLQALSQLGDATLSPEVAQLLADSEPSVRLSALSTLAAFQEKKRAQYQALANTLREEYEAAVRKSREHQR